MYVQAYLALRCCLYADNARSLRGLLSARAGRSAERSAAGARNRNCCRGHLYPYLMA